MKLHEVKTGASLNYYFHCPACGHAHCFTVKAEHGPTWNFNGNMEKPSFTPSLKMSVKDHVACHLFVTNGMIMYCNDCPHEMAGKSVSLPEWEKEW